MKEQSKSKCYLCGAEGKVLFRELSDSLWGVPGTWNTVRCTSATCGLLWVDPMPEPADISKLYERYYTHSQARSAPGRRLSVYERVRGGILASWYGYADLAVSRFWRIVGWTLGCLPLLRERIGETVMWLSASGRGRLLDIGCGEGKLLVRMKDAGWEVVGVEPDRKAAEFVREKHGLDVREGSLEQAQFDTATFDAITMKHVAEHLFDPTATLKECLRILRPGGRLVLVTPNSASAGLKRYGGDWRGLEPPRHLFLFNPANLRKAVEDAGFTVQVAKSVSCCKGSVWLNSDYIRRKRLGTWSTPENSGLLGRFVRKAAYRLKGVAYTLWQRVLYWIDRRSGEEILVLAGKP